MCVIIIKFSNNNKQNNILLVINIFILKNSKILRIKNYSNSNPISNNI